jgi:hypothetical protein
MNQEQAKSLGFMLLPAVALELGPSGWRWVGRRSGKILDQKHATRDEALAWLADLLAEWERSQP